MNAFDGGRALDHDVAVIGSGFGGSVAALRLAEKGYDVHVLEAGRRFEDEDFAKTSWNLRKYLWAPKLGCFGVQRVHKLPDALILAGAGVGGGSLNYANTLYIPPAPFFQDRQWGHITDWQDELAPHYRMGQSMLGVVTNPCEGPVEELMRAAADELGVGHTYKKTPTGVFFGMPGVGVPDPYFGGAGPGRTGCTECGNCMVGCRVGAKNTLPKNYLGLAEKLGVLVTPLRTVVAVRPLADAEAPAGAAGPKPDGARAGYEIITERTGAWTRRGRDRQVLTARHVVVAAGTWGTQSLLHAMRDGGQLPGLSDTLGVLTRTNSEALLGAMTTHRPPKDMDLTKGVAITASFHPDEDTHIENVRYGKGSNAMGALSTLAVPGEGRLPRWVRFLGVAFKDPLAIPSIEPTPWKFSERTIIGLVMQTRDNSLTVWGKRRLFGGRKLTSRQGHGEPNPTYIEPGHRAMAVIARLLQERGGRRTRAGGTLGELFDVPLTAHFLGGACISDSPENGVIDPYHRVWGYPGMHVVDGAAISANLGVNPALSITAQAERVFSLWPNKGQPDPRPAPGEPYVRLEPVPPRRPAVTTFTHESSRV